MTTEKSFKDEAYREKRLKIATQLLDGVPIGDISDGYHTYSEIYNHRNLLFINLCLRDRSNCRWRPDYEGHFVLYWESPNGQMSYHIGDELLHLVANFIEHDPNDDSWDGHTSEDVITILERNAGSRT